MRSKLEPGDVAMFGAQLKERVAATMRLRGREMSLKGTRTSWNELCSGAESVGNGIQWIGSLLLKTFHGDSP